MFYDSRCNMHGDYRKSLSDYGSGMRSHALGYGAAAHQCRSVTAAVRSKSFEQLAGRCRGKTKNRTIRILGVTDQNMAWQRGHLDTLNL
jgi:hypothetical protein